MGQNSKDFAFKLCQEVGLPKLIATINEPRWIPVSMQFPNRWLTYGNAEHSSGMLNIAHSMALGINLNCGFIPINYTVIPIYGLEKKCILVVHGKFHESNTNFTVATIHGDWNPALGYKNPINRKAVIWFIEYMKKYLEQYGGHFVLAGDFNIDYQNMWELRDELNKIMPNLFYPTIDNKITTFVDSELVSIDHVITNIKVRKLTTLLDARMSDHLIVAFKISLPYKVRPFSIAEIAEPVFIDPNCYLNLV